jgi:hypothetical protein
VNHEKFSAREAAKNYYLIHKHFVGPATADKLHSIHESLAMSHNPRHLFAGGWAAVEAAVVGIGISQADRIALLSQGDECWQQAEHGIREQNEAREAAGYNPDRATPYRLAMNRTCLPILEGMIEGDVTKVQRQKYYSDLLTVASCNAVDLLQAQEARDEDAMGAYVGVAYETLGALTPNRILSPTLIALPTLARADNGEFYPQQTHDIQLLHLNWGNIEAVTTFEVKSRLRQKFLDRYDAMLLGGRVDLLMPGSRSPVDTIEALAREHDGTASGEDREALDGMTDKVVHLVRHYRLKDTAERRCVDMRRCDAVPVERSSSRGKPSMGSLALNTGVALTTP